MKGITHIRICIITILISVVQHISSQRIHEIMTREELIQTFGRYDKLPEYEVVPIHHSHLNKRSTNGKVLMSLDPFGRNLQLWLEPTDGTLITESTPVYSISRSPDAKNVEFVRHTDAFKSIGSSVYIDYATNTSIVIDFNKFRQKRMVGVIGSENLVISPLHERLIDAVTRHRRSIDNISESQLNEYHYHIVFKRSINNIFNPPKYSLRSKRTVQNTVYPEILVIVDYNLFKLFNERQAQLLTYLMAFWNAVDLLYRPLQNPKFRFNIAGIIFAEDDYALTYVTSNTVGYDQLKCEQSIIDSKSWLYENIGLIMNTEEYDVAVTMTSLDLCEPQPDKTCVHIAFGIAEYSKVCEVNHFKREVEKTALITDVGAFNGIFVAAHELGHSFGVEHDGEKSSLLCSPNTMTIMNPQPRFRYQGGLWSQCSMDQFGKLLESHRECLFNKPKSNGKLTRYLPGQLMDANEQCRFNSLFRANASYINELICVNLWCHNHKNVTLLHSAGPALDGTPCGEEKMCIHGKCILKSTISNV